MRFTTKGDTLYAFLMAWPGASASIASLAAGKVPGSIRKVELLGHGASLEFKQDADALKVALPTERPGDYAYALKITGLKLG